MAMSGRVGGLGGEDMMLLSGSARCEYENRTVGLFRPSVNRYRRAGA